LVLFGRMMLWIYNVGKMITGDDDGKMKLMALGSIILEQTSMDKAAWIGNAAKDE
jgi:hypothetical protein